MRKLYEQDIIEILYGATLLGAGGGGSLKQGLDMIQGLKDDGEQIELDLLDVSEMRDDAYAVMVAGLGSPVAMLDPDMPRFGPDAVFAYRAFQKAFAAEGKKLEYLYSGEMGGFNTFTPMLVAILSDKDPAKRIKFVDADGNGRAVPELNTTINAFYDHPPKPMGMGSLYGDEIIVYPTTDHSGEQIARQMCMLYKMRSLSSKFFTCLICKLLRLWYTVPSAAPADDPAHRYPRDGYCSQCPSRPDLPRCTWYRLS